MSNQKTRPRYCNHQNLGFMIEGDNKIWIDKGSINRTHLLLNIYQPGINLL